MITNEQSDVCDAIRGFGADFVGFANLAAVYEQASATWPCTPHDLPFSISIGIGLDNSIIDRLLHTRDAATGALYWSACYGEVNERLDAIAAETAQLVEKLGHRALVVPATKKVDQEELLGPFSHKLAARLAGLGWIGKSCMLITPERGPRVRWVTVLTDMPFATPAQPMERRCGSCRQCVDACPAGAFSGVPFNTDEGVEVRFAVRKCQAYQ
ncbi:MAG TPA: 4Fe-4S binding protein, partial [Armatimonadota bacterium]|nr:4Fe-4S binding protein [Armatimonadota bacterium]